MWDRQEDSKGRPLSQDTLYVDTPAMRLHDPFDDGQPETRAHDIAGLGVLDPVKPVKNLRMKFFAYSYTGIFNIE